MKFNKNISRIIKQIGLIGLGIFLIIWGTLFNEKYRKDKLEKKNELNRENKHSTVPEADDAEESSGSL